MRIMAVDYGEKRTGLAVSDESGTLAGGIGTIQAEGMRSLTEQIAAKVSELGVKRIVVGNPVNMNGSFGEKSEKAAQLALRLRERLGLEVVLFDERCTTMAAHVFLNATDTRGKKRKKTIDTLSAQIILQNYLDCEKNKRPT